MAEELPFPDITQLPFQQALPALNPGIDPSALQAQDATMQSDIARQHNLQQAQTSLANLNQQQDSFLPTALAVGAMLTGNFAPMLQLQEQKRKTAYAQAIAPVMAQVSDLTNKGKLDEALDIVQSAGAQMGARAPELAQFFGEVNKRIATKQQNIENLRVAHKMLVDAGVQPDDPIQGGIVKAIGTAAKAGTPLAENVLLAIMNRFEPKSQVQEHQVVRTQPQTGAVQTTPLPQQMGKADVNTFTGNYVAEKYGVATHDLANLMNGLPVKKDDGSILQPGSPEAVQARQDLVRLQPIEGDMIQAKLIPLNPDLSIQAVGQYGATNTARRAFNREGVQAILNEDTRRKEQVAALPTKIGLYANPFLASQAGYVPVDVNPASSNFGRELPPQTYNQVMSQGGKVDFIDQKVARQVVPRLMEAVQGLDYVPLLFSEGADPNTPFNRLSQGVKDLVTKFTRVSPDSSQSLREVANVIVRDAIENLQDTREVKREEVGRLKDLISGGFTDSQHAMQASQLIKLRINQIFANYMRGNTMPESDIQKTIQQQYPNTPNEKLPTGLQKTQKDYEKFQQGQQSAVQKRKSLTLGP